jgi:hypothetical protein
MGLRVGQVPLRAGLRRRSSGFDSSKPAQGLGFTLEEIAGLLELRLRADDACGPVQATAGAKIDGKIASLRRLRRGLARLVTACRDGRDAALRLGTSLPGYRQEAGLPMIDETESGLRLRSR